METMRRSRISSRWLNNSEKLANKAWARVIILSDKGKCTQQKNPHCEGFFVAKCYNLVCVSIQSFGSFRGFCSIFTGSIPAGSLRAASSARPLAQLLQQELLVRQWVFFSVSLQRVTEAIISKAAKSSILFS